MNKIITFSFLLSILVLTSCSTKSGHKICKEDRTYEHEIKMGVIDTTKILQSISNYNEQGKLIEEISYSKGYKSNNSTMDGKTTYKYNSDNKLLEKTEYKFDRIHYKKICEYNSAGKKNLVKVYFSSETNSTDLQLWGAMRIYYNAFNKVSLKKWIGGINQFEEESSISTNSFDGKLIYSKTDSSYATYHYGTNKKVDTIKIFEPNHTLFNKSGNDLGYDEIYVFKYDKNDSLVEKIEPDSKTTYVYKDGKLFEEKQVSSYGWTLTKKYNENNKCSEIIYDVPNDEKLNYRKTLEYNENNDLIKETAFNYLNEPTYHWTFTYLYY